MATKRQQRRRSNVTGIRAQSQRFDHVRGTAYGPADDQRNVPPDAFIPEALINGCQRQLNGDAHVVTDAGGGSAGAAAKSVDGDNICAAACDAAGNGGNIVHRRHLYDDGLFVPRRLLQRKNELPQIFYRIDVVMRRGRDRVRPLWDHPGAGNVAHDFCAGQMPADARLGSLSHLDLNSSACFKIPFVHAESAARDLHNGILAVWIEIIMQSSFAGVVQNAELRCSFCQ